MLYCPNHQLSLHFRHHHHRHRNPNSTTTTTLTISSSLDHQQPQETTTTTSQDPNNLLRTQNFKTSTLLLNHINPNKPNSQNQPKLHDSISLQQKVKNFEFSHIKHKRPPKFPGSISTSPNSSPLQALFEEQTNEEELIENVIQAIEIRRNVTAEIFKECMRRGKFGITYSSNLVERLTDFIDFVMIEAADLKRLPDFKDSSFNVRARTVIEDLNIVPLVRWLKHNGLSYPKIAKLICLSRGDVKAIRRVADWLKTIHVKGEFIGVVLTKAGDNILEQTEEELDEIVEYLESNGVRRDWMGYVMSRCPQLLCSSIEEVKSRVKFFRDMGMNEKDFGTMVFDYPRVLGYFTLDEMNKKVNYLKEFGLNNEEVGRLLAFKPQLMGCSIEERWKPLVKYLYYLGVTRDGMRRMLTIKPMVFCIDLEMTIVPKVRFFQDIGIRDDAIGNMLVKFPPLLTYSLYKKIRPVVIYLLTKAGVDERDIAKVIASGPELLGSSIVHKLDINVKYFLSLGIRLRQLGEMITDFPMLLRYNIELLRPKYRYFRRTMVRPLEEVIEFPRFFSYSLEGRIIPRHKVLLENRVNFKLRYMLACSDEEFQKKVEAAVERRKRYDGNGNHTSDDFQEDDHALEEQEAIDLPASEAEPDAASESNPSLLAT